MVLSVCEGYDVERCLRGACRNIGGEPWLRVIRHQKFLFSYFYLLIMFLQSNCCFPSFLSSQLLHPLPLCPTNLLVVTVGAQYIGSLQKWILWLGIGAYSRKPNAQEAVATGLIQVQIQPGLRREFQARQRCAVRECLNLHSLILPTSTLPPAKSEP